MNISIRHYKAEDVEPFYEAVLETVDDAFQWLPWCHPGYTREEAQGWIAMQMELWNAGIEYNFLIVDDDSGKLLGGVGINAIHPLHRFGFLGYWVRSSCMGKGIATIAARQAAVYAFRNLPIHRIEILMALGNKASKRVAEKTGAVYEGIAREKLFLHDAFVDAHVFSLLPGDISSL